jgi:hypothetical protein
MLFPPVPNADVIAIRVDNRIPPNRYAMQRWGSPSTQAEMTRPLPEGTGEYCDPTVHWRLWQELRNDKNEIVSKEWQALDLGDPQFPLLMGKPQIIEAVNAAQGLQVFDEIRMFQFERRPKGDPCILGSIVNGHRKTRLYFLISWRISESDL